MDRLREIIKEKDFVINPIILKNIGKFGLTVNEFLFCSEEALIKASIAVFILVSVSLSKLLLLLYLLLPNLPYSSVNI